MLGNAEAEALMQNARAAQAEGERLWAAGDWRNAAEQGWQAVLDATAALALEVNGKLAAPAGLGDRRVSAISGSISDLAQERGGEWEDLDGRFSRAYVDLYFYAGVYDDDIGDLGAGCGGLHPPRRAAGGGVGGGDFVGCHQTAGTRPI